MKSNEKNLKKNEILVEICNSTNGLNTQQISKNTGNSIELVSYLVEEMRDEGYFELIDITTKYSRNAPHEYDVRITNKGKYFLKIDNGFHSIIQKNRQNRIWYLLKITAVVLNSIAIVVIGIYSLILSSKNSDIENEKKHLEKELKGLKEQTFIKDTITITKH